MQAYQFSRRTAIQSLAAVAAFPAMSLRAQAQISAAVAINRAARLRALSQRTTKLYAQIVLGVLADSARETMGTAQKLVQVSIDDLAKAGFTGAAVTQFAAVNQSAVAVLSASGGSPVKDGLAKLNPLADKLLSDANNLTSTLEVSTKQASARLINVAGRQRMLSQRLAKNYFFIAADLDTAATRKQMTDDRDEFKQALATLGAAPISTPSIRNELQLAQSQWVFFESTVARKPDAEGMRIVATTSERLLDVNNNLTQLYETALRDLLGNT